MKYYIIAGEASGDLHGSNLIKGILESDPQAEIRFWGGDLMVQAAGHSGNLVKHYRENSVMGIIEVLMSINKISRLMKLCKQDIKAFMPDVAIFIDYPGFNLRISKYTKSLGIKNFYYIAPKVWAWKEWRVKQLKKRIDRLFVIFPFEIEYFKRHGIDAFYAGNPLMDSIASRGEELGTFQEFARQNGLDPNKPMVALVAGSRSVEIEHNLPPMVEVARRMPDYQFVVTGVDWLSKQKYEKCVENSTVKVLYGKTYPIMAHSKGALVTSGTATLEAALLGVPQVVCYRGLGITIWIAYRLVSAKFISLVNLIMDRAVVKELIQKDFTPENAVIELEAILPGGSKEAIIREDYRQLQKAIGEAGASVRIAKQMVKELKMAESANKVK